MQIASAKLPVFVQSAAGETTVVKGGRKGIGYRDTPLDYAWETHTLPLEAGSRLFLATDGVSDQIGEAKKIAFGWERFKASVAAPAGTAPAQVGDQFMQAFLAYQGREIRRDDVTMLCVEFTQDLLTSKD
jgi:serine phosphatase RsbU (regulator of sigma subunit)